MARDQRKGEWEGDMARKTNIAVANPIGSSRFFLVRVVESLVHHRQSLCQLRVSMPRLIQRHRVSSIDVHPPILRLLLLFLLLRLASLLSLEPLQPAAAVLQTPNCTKGRVVVIIIYSTRQIITGIESTSCFLRETTAKD